MKSCNECKFACFVDYGCYTTESTEFYCAKDVHPEGHFDRFYGDDKKLNHADICKEFVEGECIHMDCDKENYNELTSEQKSIYDLIEF